MAGDLGFVQLLPHSSVLVASRLGPRGGCLRRFWCLLSFWVARVKYAILCITLASFNIFGHGNMVSDLVDLHMQLQCFS